MFFGEPAAVLLWLYIQTYFPFRRTKTCVLVWVMTAPSRADNDLWHITAITAFRAAEKNRAELTWRFEGRQLNHLRRGKRGRRRRWKRRKENRKRRKMRWRKRRGRRWWREWEEGMKKKKKSMNIKESHGFMPENRIKVRPLPDFLQLIWWKSLQSCRFRSFLRR